MSDAYRMNRGRFNPTGGLVNTMRRLRDMTVRLKRWLCQQPQYGTLRHKGVPGETRIAFIGIWDTVAAYGTPLTELTRGIDEWIWPLSMPDYRLSDHIDCARHALALDDERDSFHPLLWDERQSAASLGREGSDKPRLQQVWFAGMHADVGGGYPDDALALVPLLWMIEEARCSGIRFNDEICKELESKKSLSAPIHNSRRGIGAYYRYQPRRISAWMMPEEKTSLIMQDPRKEGCPRLSKVHIHVRVFDRIRPGPDHYAPLAIPEHYELVGGKPGETAETDVQARQRIATFEAVRDTIWRRRVNYFATLAVSM